MASKEWMSLFLRAAALCLPIQWSDHSPLVIDTHWVVRLKLRPKRFEEYWLGVMAFARSFLVSGV